MINVYYSALVVINNHSVIKYSWTAVRVETKSADPYIMLHNTFLLNTDAYSVKSTHSVLFCPQIKLKVLKTYHRWNVLINEIVLKYQGCLYSKMIIVSVYKQWCKCYVNVFTDLELAKVSLSSLLVPHGKLNFTCSTASTCCAPSTCNTFE